MGGMDAYAHNLTELIEQKLQYLLTDVFIYRTFSSLFCLQGSKYRSKKLRRKYLFWEKLRKIALFFEIVIKSEKYNLVLYFISLVSIKILTIFFYLFILESQQIRQSQLSTNRYSRGMS